ncbi:hypothetical protein [Isoptericola sp. NPDC057391]|uniref:hypothetical protein n=1 Tax=Isoptericola sp. NPDC057391 TaxID=3346117 RepID=UPI00362B2ECD
MVDFTGCPLVVGIVPDQPELVALTADCLARAMRAPTLHFANVDTSRYVVEEHEDGSVLHGPVDPEVLDVVDRLDDPDAVGRDDARARLADYVARAEERRTELARKLDMADEFIELLHGRAR